MSASISTLPVWKKGSSASEWLAELSALALENPEKWRRVVVIFEKTNAENMPIETRQFSWGIPSNTDILGTIETAKLELFEHMKGRRP